MKATNSGKLAIIPDCYIVVGQQRIELNNLPEITDNKAAVYSNENVIGRSFPLYTYSYSDNRTIGMQLHFFVTEEDDVENNLNNLRLLQSAVYPRSGDGSIPFKPPVVCKLKCGELLAMEELCCVLQSYSVNFPTEVAWSISKTNTGSTPFTPFRFDVSTQWLVVYSSSNLPDNSRIIKSGR